MASSGTEILVEQNVSRKSLFDRSLYTIYTVAVIILYFSSNYISKIIKLNIAKQNFF